MKGHRVNCFGFGAESASNRLLFMFLVEACPHPPAAKNFNLITLDPTTTNAVVYQKYPPKTGHRNPTAAKVRPTVPAPAKPMGSPPFPIAKACPGPKTKPRGNREPKEGKRFGKRVDINKKVISRPSSACRAYWESTATEVAKIAELACASFGGGFRRVMAIKEIFNRW